MAWGREEERKSPCLHCLSEELRTRSRSGKRKGKTLMRRKGGYGRSKWVGVRRSCFVLLTRGRGRFETRPPVALGSSPELSASWVCCCVLLTRGWGRLETRPPVALGSSPELFALIMSLAPPVHPIPIFLTDWWLDFSDKMIFLLETGNRQPAQELKLEIATGLPTKLGKGSIPFLVIVSSECIYWDYSIRIF